MQVSHAAYYAWRKRPAQLIGLKVIQRQAYKAATRRNDSHPVADNLLNQDFNPTQANQAWAGDVTYLWTHEGGMYLAVVMDL